jgi:hypothetical protein
MRAPTALPFAETKGERTYTMKIPTVLLPIGKGLSSTSTKKSSFLRVPEVNDQEHEYIVVSMTPR